MGMAVLILLLSVLGLLGWLTFWPIVILGAAIILVSFSVWRAVFNDLMWEKVEISFAYNTISWFLFTILALVMSMNIIDLIRPFPIGWDDMGVYLNFPHLIANSGSLLAGFPNQAYMPVSALGFIVANSTTVALFISWLGGILATFTLYVFGKRLINTEAGLLMATIMYSLPMVMHQSFGDMKLDMPLFFFIIAGFLAIFLSIEKREDFKVALSVDKSLWIIAGFLLGTAMAIKVTTAIVIFALIVLLAWRFSGIFAGLTALFFLHAVYFYQFVTASDISDPLKRKIAMVSLLLAVVCGAFTLFKRENIVKSLKPLGIILIGMAVAFAPWAYKHWSETHTLSINALLYGGPVVTPQPDFTAAGVNLAACQFTSGSEEMGRYINPDGGIMRYLGLPWDLTMNINQAGFYVDISFLFLGLIPLLLLFWKHKEWPEFWQNVLLMFVISWYFWLFVGSGIPWYGIGSFLFALLLIVRVKELFEKKVLWGNILIILAIVISLVSVVSLRESKFGSEVFLSYAFGLRNADQVMDATSPNYRLIASTINQETSTTEHPNYVYRIGTFITYFLNNNRERLYNDAQLDVFNCIDGDHTDDARTVERLRKLGFHYMVYDTNTATIEKDINGTLHQKVNRFTSFAMNNLKVIAPTDPSRYNEGILFLEIPQT